MLFMLCTCISLLLTARASSAESTCSDVDADACTLMEHSQPDLCNSGLGETACPRYCGKCPLECYTCQDLLQDISQCNFTTCNVNQTCYFMEVFDFDQSHGFRAGCAAKELCVPHGASGSQLFGRSSSRVQTTCCDTDRCNGNLETTTSAAASTPSPSTQEPYNIFCHDVTPKKRG